MTETASRRVLKFDENGFTGSNLLDATQPFFAIGSTNLREDEAGRSSRERWIRSSTLPFSFAISWRAPQ